MGPHLEFTGKACARIEPCLKPFLLWAIEREAKISRLDLTIDEPVGLLDLNEVQRVVRAGGCVSKFRSEPRIEEFFHPKTGALTGKIIRFGSRTSKVCLRFYDKAMQVGEDFHWVRVELELKARIAQQVAEDWISGVSLNELFFGILSNYLSFRHPGGDGNRSRWPVESWWQTFLDQGPKATFRGHTDLPKDDLEWFVRGYDRVLARVARKYGPHIFKEMISSGEDKLRGGTK